MFQLPAVMSFLTGSEVLFEEELTRNPYHLKTWMRYLTYKSNAEPKSRFKIFKRALGYLARSYKLWWAYLNERLQRVQQLPITHSKHMLTISIFENALLHMHKMPLIW